jgi:hypothetical protein
MQGCDNMKRLAIWSLVLLLTALVIATTSAGAAGPPPPKTPRVLEQSVSARTEDEPIHMPDLRGRTLEYATDIWDDDEPLPQITVVRLNRDPNAVVVRQQPAPGTLVVPARARITLTLGKATAAPNSNGPSAPARFPRITAAAGQATLLRPPYLQNLTASSATIVWTTAEDGPSEVRYGVSDFALSAPATSSATATPAPAPYNQYYVHEATLTGLGSNTTYQYKIFTNGADLTPGGTGQVRAALPPGLPFRFVAFGDSGDGSQNQKDIATRLLQVQPDLVVHTGDVIYQDATYDGLEKRYFQIYSNLIKNVWVAPSAGNHDMSYNNGKSIADVFVNPPNGSSDPVNRELYYSFDYGNAHFIILDNFLSFSTGSAQYNWLKSDLAATNQFWKFVVFHVPVYSSNTSQVPKDNAKEVQYLAPLFEQYHVNIVLNGHWHNYERMYPLLGGQVSTIQAGGVVYLITGGGGAGLAGVGSGTLNPRTAAKVQAFHLTMFDVAGCRLQLSAVRKVSGTSDTFDASDIFDSYTIDRCVGAPPTATATHTPTNTPTPTDTPSPTSTSNPAATPTNTPTAAPTNTPTATALPGGTRIKDITFENAALVQATSGADSSSGSVTLETTTPLKSSYSATFATVTSAYLQENFTAADDMYVSFVLRVNALPGAAARIAMFSNSGTTVGNLQLMPDGRLQLRDNTSTIGISTIALTPGVIYHVGIHQKKGIAGNAVLEAYLANDGAAFGGPFAATTSGAWITATDRLRFGATAAGALNATFDDIKIDTGALP